ncbi:hypothetical protein [Nocardia higoensis]|uniref:hypothetical protein n=1 Tax=Nocardia higoensis TaxID=228599 RepID=UPI0002E6E40D|nr:hypothetical protein [Nocardia higoensis]
MQLRSELRLRTAIEAMTRVVIPALPADDQLANEQAQLVVGMLSNALEWLPWEFAFDRAELSSLVDAASEAAETSTSPVVDNAIRTAKDILARAGADPRDLVAGVRELRTALAAHVDSVYESGSAEEQRAVSRSVLDAVARETPLLRSAYQGHGFEGPATLPPLSTLLTEPR